MISRRDVLTIASISTALAAGVLAPAAVRADTAGVPTPQTRIAVAVATLWTSPTAPRRIDRKATATPSDTAGWLGSLTIAGRRGLNGRVESQALYGQPVEVLEQRGTWARVALPDQPSPKSPSGYPGWIPSAQLVETPTAQPAAESAVAARDAVVTAPTAWAHADSALTTRAIRLSYGTRLPVLGMADGAVAVSAPDGLTLWLPPTRVAVVEPGVPARTPSSSALVAEARKFLGLPYLWGGTSGFGFDCSGLAHLIHAHLGITIPRDATPQFATGTPVARVSDLRKGDLVFFRNTSGSIHHVGIYAGRGRMIHAPRTGRPVQYSSITRGIWAREFAGGRRYA